jgi:hypothetical protein
MTYRCSNAACGCQREPEAPAPVVIDKALVIEPGKAYVLELDYTPTASEAARISAVWQTTTGSKCVILANDVRIAREVTE